MSKNLPLHQNAPFPLTDFTQGEKMRLHPENETNAVSYRYRSSIVKSIKSFWKWWEGRNKMETIPEPVESSIIENTSPGIFGKAKKTVVKRPFENIGSDSSIRLAKKESYEMNERQKNEWNHHKNIHYAMRKRRHDNRTGGEENVRKRDCLRV